MVATTSHLSTAGQRLRWGYLGCAATPLVGAVLHNQGYHLPFVNCPIQAFTGVPCPACGMTRSLLSLAKGDLGLAFSYHLFGPFLFLSCLIAVIHLTLELKTRRSLSTFYTRAIASWTFWEALFGLLLLYHSSRLVGLIGSVTITEII